MPKTENFTKTYHHPNELNYVHSGSMILSSLCDYNAAAQLNFVKSPHSFIYNALPPSLSTPAILAIPLRVPSRSEL